MDKEAILLKKKKHRDTETKHDKQVSIASNNKSNDDKNENKKGITLLEKKKQKQKESKNGESSNNTHSPKTNIKKAIKPANPKKNLGTDEGVSVSHLLANKPTESRFFEDEFTEEKKKNTQNKHWINKQRTMVVASRGVSHAERYMMNDLIDLIPHAKKECKIEKNVAKSELNEICINHDCKNCIYFEHRKREFLMWLFRSPEGPCVKFQIRNIHTVTDIRLLGNCLKYSRPLLSFDKSFDELPHLKLIKEMFVHAFNTPKNHPKCKPFYDHVLCFYNINNNIFFRNYQILNELKEKFTDADDASKLQLVEIGPRYAMTIIKIFDGPLGGKTLYSNPNYIPPSMLIRKNNQKYKDRRVKEEKEKEDLEHTLKTKKDNPRKWLEDK